MPPQPNGSFAWVQACGRPALVCRPLEALAPHFFTTRAWRLGSAAADLDRAWAEVAETIGVPPARLGRAHQVHGAAVHVQRPAAGDDDVPRALPEADILIGIDGGSALAVQTADCVPLLIADPRTGAVAAAHAGWRGLAARVPQVAVDALAREFGAAASDLMVAIGPSIGACCYEVGADVHDAFSSAGFDAVDVGRWFSVRPRPSAANASMPGLPSPPRADHWFFEGAASAGRQLEIAGVRADRIHIAGLCTASHPDLLCSYRRESTAAGRLAAAISARRPRP
jgi:YfiH family protein